MRYGSVSAVALFYVPFSDVVGLSPLLLSYGFVCGVLVDWLSAIVSTTKPSAKTALALAFFAMAHKSILNRTKIPYEYSQSPCPLASFVDGGVAAAAARLRVHIWRLLSLFYNGERKTPNKRVTDDCNNGILCDEMLENCVGIKKKCSCLFVDMWNSCYLS